MSWRHSLREMDIELMRRLSPRVNVIPVVGKADSLTPSELRGFKKRVSTSASSVSFICINIFLDADHGGYRAL
jgi:cell division control protein 11